MSYCITRLVQADLIPEMERAEPRRNCLLTRRTLQRHWDPGSKAHAGISSYTWSKNTNSSPKSPRYVSPLACPQKNL